MTDNNSGSNGTNPTYTITVGGGGSGANNGSTTSIPITNNSGWYTITTGGSQQAQQYIPLNGDLMGPPIPEKKKNSDGCVCKKCKELFPYAEPNQDDGTLICYGCRIGW